MMNNRLSKTSIKKYRMSAKDRANIRMYVGTIVIVGEVLNHVVMKHIKNKKLKRVNERRLENVVCIENAYNRLIKMALDPVYDPEAFMNALKDETEFLAIIRRQQVVCFSQELQGI